jgi:hypothetical protein
MAIVQPEGLCQLQWQHRTRDLRACSAVPQPTAPPRNFFFGGEGPRSRRYGRTAALRLIVQPYDVIFFVIFLVMEHRWNEIDRGSPKYSGKNLSQFHFVHHKSHMDWPRDRTRASAVGGRRLTAWAMARPVSRVRKVFSETVTARVTTRNKLLYELRAFWLHWEDCCMECVKGTWRLCAGPRR